MSSGHRRTGPCRSDVRRRRAESVRARYRLRENKSLMAFAAVNVALSLIVHQVFEFVLQPFVSLEIIRRVRQHDVAVLVERHAIFRPRQVFGSQPEVQRVLCHLVEMRIRGAIAGAPAERVTPSSLPTKEMCPIGYGKSSSPK